jgi:hypothetical protein
VDLSVASVNAFSHAISAQGRRSGLGDAQNSASVTNGTEVGGEENSANEALTDRRTQETSQGSRLTAEEQQQLKELQQRDREVKAHELAHKAVGGRYVTGGSFTYETGPDGHRYAIGGEVTIDSSSGSTPEETLRKAELIRRAALAPADPSPQDYRVASQANMMAAEARSDINAEKQEALQEAREARIEQGDEEGEAETPTQLPPLNRKAVDSFTAVAISSLETQPDPIDEIV